VPPYGPDEVRGEIERGTGTSPDADAVRPKAGDSTPWLPQNPLLSRNFGEVIVSTLVAKYKKIKFETHENVGYGDIHVPTLEMQTEAYWLTFADESKMWMDEAGLDLGAGLRGLASLLSHVVPLYVLCDPRDVASVPMVRSPHDELPCVYLYDKYPGGIGLARKVYDVDLKILAAAVEILRGCGCAGGCPSCVGPEVEAESRAKRSVQALLESIMSA
jgi:DEAD/DEAH box helicase domain-containing protein